MSIRFFSIATYALWSGFGVKLSQQVSTAPTVGVSTQESTWNGSESGETTFMMELEQELDFPSKSNYENITELQYGPLPENVSASQFNQLADNHSGTMPIFDSKVEHKPQTMIELQSLHTEPQTIPDANSESETESEYEFTEEVSSMPHSEPKTEPETEKTPIFESDGEHELQADAKSKSETISEYEFTEEVSSMPHSEPKTEPETEKTPIYKSDSEHELEADVKSKSETKSDYELSEEVSTTPHSEPQTEPGTEKASISDNNFEDKRHADENTETETECECDHSSSETEAEFEDEEFTVTNPEVESGSTGYPETDTISNAESEDTEPETIPSALEIILPPFCLIVVMIIALSILMIKSRRESIHSSMFGVSEMFLRSINNGKKPTNKCHPYTNDNIQMIDLTTANDCLEPIKAPIIDTNQETFFTEFDMEVLQSLRNCYNQPKELVHIALPALVSLILCPLTLYMYEPFRKIMWPDIYPVMPNINDAIACYLAPAGLVYATSFGFAFQQVLNKQHEIMTKMTEEISMLDQIATFTVKIRLSLPTKQRILLALKTECIFMVLQILDRKANTFTNKPRDDVKVKVWTVVDLLREVDTSLRYEVDRILCDRIMSHIMKLNSICSDSMGVLHTKIHPVKWLFLETLGFFSFLGILLLWADSYRMELVMCIVTVFSISMLCYVVSDLDSPFSGFFRVDIGVLEEVLRRLDMINQMSCTTGKMEVFYPE